MSVLNHIWPWSELRRLREQCHAHWEFGEACMAYMDEIEPGSCHIRFCDKLYCISIDHAVVVDRSEPTAGCVARWKKTIL